MNDKIQCVGCGVTIQIDYPNELGYIPISSLEKGIGSGQFYCQRCFRLRHYNEIHNISLTSDDFLCSLNALRQEDALIVNVVDIFDFDGSFIPELHRFVGDNPVLLVGNKVDILPKSLKKPKLVQWMKERSYEAGLRPVDILLTSMKEENEIEVLLQKIEEYREDHDVYIVGVTNVGKSTLTNQIIKNTSGVKDVITTSHFPGTTLAKIEIPFKDGCFLIDTPGIIHPHQMTHYLKKKDLRIISPVKEIKPKVYQLNEKQTLFLGGLARLDFISGRKGSFIVYVSNDVDLHRTKLEKADAFYQKHVGSFLQPPHAEEVEAFPELIRFEFSVKEKTDIIFSGLGWITVTDPSIVAGWAPKGVSVKKRKALI